MDKQNAVYPYDRILFSHKRAEVLIYGTTWMNLMLSERQTPKGYVLCDFLYMKRPEEADTLKQINKSK